MTVVQLFLAVQIFLANNMFTILNWFPTQFISQVLLAQVVAMVLHRFETCVHLMARTPFKPGKFVRNWSFKDAELPEEPDQDILIAIRKRMQKRRASQSPKSSRSSVSYENIESLPSTANHIA